jgi:hypothetical protein
MFYTYAHYRADDGRLFYIGKGSIKYKRHLTKKGRNPHWHHIVNKHGFRVEILARWSDESDAFDHEKAMIKTFRELGYKLANIADSGQGPTGRVLSDSEKNNLRLLNLGKKQSKESIEKTRKSNIGRKHSPEWIDNARKALIGRKATDIARANMSTAHSGERRTYQDVSVRCINYDIIFRSVTLAHILTGAQKGNIVKVCRGERKETIGLVFEYINDNS